MWWSFSLLAVLLGPPLDESWRPPELRVQRREPLKSFDAVQEIAFRYLDRPYVMGGVGSPAFDCSGFVCRVFAEAGYALPRVSRDQARAGIEVPFDALAPGDLLFFAETGEPISHVGLYLGEGELIHASSGRGRVVVSDLGARWFRERLTRARRILPSSTATSSTATSSTAVAFVPVPTLELEEHAGAFALPMTLRLPARLPPPSTGPELPMSDETSVAVRAAVVTENRVVGLVVAPELNLHLESLAVQLDVAAPVRFEVGSEPSVGRLDRAVDYARFLRTLSIGLRGADLELRLSRLSDLTLLEGYVLHGLSPSSASAGVPGFAIGSTPLSFFGRVRAAGVDVHALLDDVVDPGLAGLGLELPIGGGPLSVGVGFSTDQRSLLEIEPGVLLRRALSVGELEANLDLVSTSRWSLEASAHGAIVRAMGDVGAGTALRVVGEHRFGRRRSDAVTMVVTGSYLGPHFVDGLMGPTYLPARSALAGALFSTVGRLALGGEARVRIGRLRLGLSYGEGTSKATRHPLDQRVEALVELSDLPVSGTRFLDLRLVYAARAPFLGRTLRHDVLHGALAWRLSSWLSIEGYLEKGLALEGGGALAVRWIP